MLISQVMNPRVVVTDGSITVKKACEIMASHKIGSIVVTRNREVVGIITERDVLNVIARGLDPASTWVRDVMTTEVITIRPDQSVEDAAELMARHGIKKLPVVENKKLLGIVTASDIVVIQPKLIQKIASLVSIRFPAYTGG